MQPLLPCLAGLLHINLSIHKSALPRTYRFLRVSSNTPTAIFSKQRISMPSATPSKSNSSPSLAKPTHEHLMTYRIARGEQGVLTFEPYKSILLPLWRFRTPEIARKSSKDLWARFEQYNKEDDFVGMDMCRKFIQMGMTRAKRYANHAGGRKYNKKSGAELPKSSTHKDAKDKLEASEIFREAWDRCRAHEGYQQKKEKFMKEQKAWDKQMKQEKR